MGQPPYAFVTLSISAMRRMASARAARNDQHSGFPSPSGPLTGVDAFASREVAIPVGWWVTPEDRERVRLAVWQSCQMREGAYA